MLLVLAVLVACSEAKRGPDAAERYAIFARHPSTAAEKCAEAAKVAEAYLYDKDEAKYDHWHSMSEMNCLVDQARRLNHREGIRR
jgi:hypothetical protein